MVRMMAEMHLDWSLSGLLSKVREVSNKIMCGSSMAVLEDSAYSQMLVDWGQYIDHDISFTPQSSSRSAFAEGRDCLHTCSNAHPCFPMQVTLQWCCNFTFIMSDSAEKGLRYSSFQLQPSDKLSSNDPVPKYKFCSSNQATCYFIIPVLIFELAFIFSLI